MKRKLILAFALTMIACLCFCLAACDEETALEYTFSDEWTYDADNHWHEATCDECDIVSGLATHTWNDGDVLSAPTEISSGQTKYTCTVCGKEKIVEITPINSAKVSVHYDLSGGAWADEEDAIPDYSVQYINKNSIILTENEPVLNNCVFGGWDVQVNATEKTANIKAIWFAGMEGVTDENGEPINPKRLTLDENGEPDFVPTKSASYIDVNNNGNQDKDEPLELYTFTGWAKSNSNGLITIRPTFRKQTILVNVRFDFNGGYPSNIPNGINPYNLENPSQGGTPSYYYQIKKVYATNSSNNLNIYRAMVMDNDTTNCYAYADITDIYSYNGLDQVSIPVRPGFTFMGWATKRYDEPTSDIVLQTQQNGAPISSHAIYVSSDPSLCRQPSYYAVWKQDGTNSTIKMETRVAFDFNGGYPSMYLGGTNPSSLDTTATIWETNTTPALNHYVQYKIVAGISSSNTTFDFTVSDDSTQNSIVDGISIPVRTGFYFLGWALSHDTSVVMNAPIDSCDFTFDTSTNVYTFDGSSITQNGTNATFYAIWRGSGSGKAILQYIEDILDFSTGDGSYYSDAIYDPQCAPQLSSNPYGGIFLETMYNFGGVPITAPNPCPLGGILNDVYYEFDHWTYDPVNNPTLDAFDSNTNVDIPYVWTSSNALVLRFYAVYRQVDKCVYNVCRDVGGTVYIDDFIIDPAMDGQYLVVLFVPEEHAQAVTVGVKIEVEDGVTGEITELMPGTVPPTRLEPHYDHFYANAGDRIIISYFNDPSLGDPALGGLGGGLLSVQIFYLG